jgi:hypothetical protein
VVEGARLESVYGGNVIAGSNPVLSANLKCDHLVAFLFSLECYQTSLVIAPLVKFLLEFW